MNLRRHLPTHRLLADYSLWSANLANLAESIAATESHADLYHLDVADARFVPGLLFFPDLVAALRPLTAKLLHVHLMVVEPHRLIPEFLAAGADIITLHAENAQVGDSLALIAAAGKAAGLALQLDTPIDAVRPHLTQLDLILMMGTPLGIKGVGLDDRACERLTAMQQLIRAEGRTDELLLSADGGIRDHTVPRLRAAGADMITPGSLVFKSTDLAATTAWLHQL